MSKVTLTVEFTVEELVTAAKLVGLVIPNMQAFETLVQTDSFKQELAEDLKTCWKVMSAPGNDEDTLYTMFQPAVVQAI